MGLRVKLCSENNSQKCVLTTFTGGCPKRILSYIEVGRAYRAVIIDFAVVRALWKLIEHILHGYESALIPLSHKAVLIFFTGPDLCLLSCMGIVLQWESCCSSVISSTDAGSSCLHCRAKQCASLQNGECESLRRPDHIV